MGDYNPLQDLANYGIRGIERTQAISEGVIRGKGNPENHRIEFPYQFVGPYNLPSEMTMLARACSTIPSTDIVAVFTLRVKSAQAVIFKRTLISANPWGNSRPCMYGHAALRE
ncbi:MAG: hypothetical protein AABX11_03550 [Nanoarchaeota archaeon]